MPTSEVGRHHTPRIEAARLGGWVPGDTAIAWLTEAEASGDAGRLVAQGSATCALGPRAVRPWPRPAAAHGRDTISWWWKKGPGFGIELAATLDWFWLAITQSVAPPLKGRCGHRIDRRPVGFLAAGPLRLVATAEGLATRSSLIQAAGHTPP